MFYQHFQWSQGIYANCPDYDVLNLCITKSTQSLSDCITKSLSWAPLGHVCENTLVRGRTVSVIKQCLSLPACHLSCLLPSLWYGLPCAKFMVRQVQVTFMHRVRLAGSADGADCLKCGPVPIIKWGIRNAQFWAQYSNASGS